jgi:hypothetical protein
MKKNGKIFPNYKGIPAMTPTVVHDYLRQIGCGYTGQGVAIELGCWVGATAVPLLEGLVQAGYKEPYFCYDRWQANEEQVIKFYKYGMKIRLCQDTFPIFERNVAPVYSNIQAHKGDLPETLMPFPNKPIEICLFDAPKMDPVFTGCVERLLPYFIPGVTIWGLLDFNFWLKKQGVLREKLQAPVKWMEGHNNNFEKLISWGDQCSCVFFKYVKQI